MSYKNIGLILKGYQIIVVFLIYLTAIGLTPCGSSTVHIYTQTICRTTQSTQTIHGTIQLTNWEESGPFPVFVSYTLAFALHLNIQKDWNRQTLTADVK